MVPSDESLDAATIGAALQLFPRQVRAAILSDAGFRERVAPGVTTFVGLGRTGAEFDRSKLFGAARQVLNGNEVCADIVATDGAIWRMKDDGADGIVVAREGVVESCPEFLCMAPGSEARIGWFEAQTEDWHVGDARSRSWREILAERPLRDDELEELLEDFRLTPMHSAAEIRERLRRPQFNTADLVPSDLRYFDRLAGEPPTGAGLRGFVSDVLRSHVRALLRWNPYEGLLAALALSSHQMVSEVFDLTTVPLAEVSRVLEWLVDHGDRISQVGAIECGLRHLDALPDIEPYLAAMTRQVCADDPEKDGGRLKLLSSVVVLVEGEIVRRGIARRRPPFWRRLVSIAHAAVVEREVLGASLEVAEFSDWAFRSGWTLYRMQNLVDLRQEPRWLPDFIAPAQLRAELIGRIVIASERYREKVGDGEFAEVLEKVRATAQSQESAPKMLLPGPLEGGLESVIESPAALASGIRAELEAAELTAGSFTGLVNSSLICRKDADLTELAARGLSRVGHHLRRSGGGDTPTVLLNGLAVVSAVQRSTTLAKEVRNLYRVARRSVRAEVPPAEALRVALVAAASREELVAWAEVVGDWVTELGFDDMTRQEAVALQGEVYVLLQLEPSLWETCGRAEAALSAFLKVSSGDAEERRGT